MSEEIKVGDMVIWNDDQILGKFEHDKEYRVVKAYENSTGKYLSVEDIVSGLIYEGWYACRFKKVESKKFDWFITNYQRNIKINFYDTTRERVEVLVKEVLGNDVNWKTAYVFKLDHVITKTNQFEVKNV